MPQVPVIDVLSLTWFVLLWAGYTVYADRRARPARSLRAVMHRYRVQWMQQMLLRDNRVADVNIVRNLLAGVSFFASTTLLILAGVVTVLGSTDQVIVMVRELPFAAGTTLVQWELKLLVLGVIFVYAFFKFTWALRQFNYCTTLIGAAPRGPDDVYAGRVAGIATHASKDFNQGLRAYYFAFAGVAWFLHPWLSMASSALVVYILHQREFQSRTLRALTGPSVISRSLHLPARGFGDLYLGARSA